jgi:hypothetical protein
MDNNKLDRRSRFKVILWTISFCGGWFITLAFFCVNPLANWWIFAPACWTLYITILLEAASEKLLDIWRSTPSTPEPKPVAPASHSPNEP